MKNNSLSSAHPLQVASRFTFTNSLHFGFSGFIVLSRRKQWHATNEIKFLKLSKSLSVRISSTYSQIKILTLIWRQVTQKVACRADRPALDSIAKPKSAEEPIPNFKCRISLNVYIFIWCRNRAFAKMNGCGYRAGFSINIQIWAIFQLTNARPDLRKADSASGRKMDNSLNSCPIQLKYICINFETNDNPLLAKFYRPYLF